MSEYIITCDKETALWVANDVDSMKPIIRCRDCTGFVEGWDGYECERFSGEYHRAEPDGFCSWGERKEGGE